MNLYPLIQELSDGEYHTGTQLGEQLQVSRTAIWKQIQKLPELGIEILANRQQGYRLEQPLDLLDSKMIDQAPQFAGLTDWVFKVEPVVDSTNFQLISRVKQASDTTKQLLAAEMQTSGRGRRGRSWESPFASSISCSLACTFEGPAQELQGLSLAVGVLVEAVLADHGFADLGLKWPNDIYYQGAKLGGILIEVSGDLAGPCQLVVGVGLNIYPPANFDPQVIDQPISFLCPAPQAKASRLRSSIVAALGVRLAELLDSYAVKGFAPWQDRWNQLHIWADQDAYVVTPGKAEAVTLKQVNELGELLVIDAQGQEKRLNAGEVSLRAEI